MESKRNSIIWQRRTALVRRAINGLRWMEVLLPALVIVSIPTAVLLYGMRIIGAAPHMHVLLTAVALLIACGISLRRSRGHFLVDEQVLVLLETRLGLGARLSTAFEGRGSWPVAADYPLWGLFHIRWLPLHLLPLVAAAVIATVVMGTGGGITRCN